MKNKRGTFSRAVEENQVKKEKICGTEAKLETEEKEKEAGSVPSSKKPLEGSWPNGNEPQGLLCFIGRSSACENL